MKFDHPGAACLAVQAIDILRDDQIDPAGLLQPRQRVVAATGSRPGHRGPTEEAARPVTPAGAFQVQEVMLPHRLRALPVALPVAIRRNPARRAQPGAGKDHHGTLLQQPPHPIAGPAVESGRVRLDFRTPDVHGGPDYLARAHGKGRPAPGVDGFGVATAAAATKCHGAVIFRIGICFRDRPV